MEQPEKQEPDLVLQICIAGGLTDDPESNHILLSRLDKVIHDTEKYLTRVANQKNGFSEKQPTIRFLTSVHLIEEELVEAISQKYPKYRFLCVSEQPEDTIHPALQEELTVLGEKPEAVLPGSGLIYSWICDQTDFTIIVEDEKEPKYQDFLKYCKYVSIPAVTIYNSTHRHLLWTANSYYDSYDNDKLEAYLESLLLMKGNFNVSEENRRFLLHIPLWGNLYNRYLKKNKDKPGTGANTGDTLVTQSGNLDSISNEAETTRKQLYQLYDAYDRLAIQYANDYHSSIYLRAVIPLAVTIVLAIGFYTETIFGFWKLQITQTLSFWSILAGMGFFLHALLNLYIYILSENKVIQSWHKNFIDNRFIAEALRLTIHFIPFGIPINYLNQLNKFGAKNKYNQSAVRRLRCLLKGIGMPGTMHTRVTMTTCIDSLEELVNDQLSYHKRSANQYARIYEKLKKHGRLVFSIGFIFVLLRGVLQLYISFHHIPDQSFVKAFANMLALLFPVWATYFSSKLTMCNFEGLYNNHRNMIDEINILKQKINDEQQKDHLTYADLYYLSKDITTVILGDVSEWYSQINARKVTRL